MKALSTSQMNDRLDFIRSYTEASNASSGSEVDANANVTRKTLATLEAEMYKPYTITLNRAMVRDKVREMFGWEVGNNYLLDLAEHFIYVHDEDRKSVV